MAETKLNATETPAPKERFAFVKNLPNRFPRTTRVLALVGAGTVAAVAVGTARGLKETKNSKESDSGSFDYSPTETHEVKEA